MNSDNSKRWEREISRALKDLPDLEAPASLVGKVMNRLEQRSARVWYRRPWPTWPVLLRAGAIAALAALFVGLCFAGWQFAQTPMAVAATHRTGDWLSGLGAAFHTLVILLNSICLVFRKLGTGFLILCFLAAGLGYVLCVGLGTVFVRLAFAKQ